MGTLSVVIFITVLVLCTAYALFLEWCNRRGLYTAGEYTIDRVVVGELITVGIPTLVYGIASLCWPRYAERWASAWSAVGEVVIAYTVSQCIGGMVIGAWQRLKHYNEFYNEDEET